MTTGKIEVEEFQLPDQSTIAIEVQELKFSRGFTGIGRGDSKEIISYQKAIDRVRPAADYLLETIRKLEAKPQEVEISFGIKLSTKAGAIIASAAAEGNFSVKLTWKRS